MFLKLLIVPHAQFTESGLKARTVEFNLEGKRLGSVCMCDRPETERKIQLYSYIL